MLKLKYQIRAIHAPRENGSIPVVGRFLRDDCKTLVDTAEIPLAFSAEAAATMKVGDTIEFDQVVAPK